METRTEYEKMIIKEVREMPGAVPPLVLEILHSLKEGVLSVKVRHEKREARGSGLCGIWKWKLYLILIILGSVASSEG